MANAILLDVGTKIVWSDTTDYADNMGMGTRTHQLDLTSLAAGSAREGAKADLLREASSTRFATRYVVRLAVEFASASGVLSGETVEVYLGFSGHATAGTGNPGGLDGAADTDSQTYAGTAGDSVADSLHQLTLVGKLITTSDNTTVVQIQTIGTVPPEARYVTPIVFNNTTGAFIGAGLAVDMALSMEPQIDELQ